MNSESQCRLQDAYGRVASYYVSPDTRIHVEMSTIDFLLDYGKNTPEDDLRIRAGVVARLALSRQNRGLLSRTNYAGQN